MNAASVRTVYWILPDMHVPRDLGLEWLTAQGQNNLDDKFEVNVSGIIVIQILINTLI